MNWKVGDIAVCINPNGWGRNGSSEDIVSGPEFGEENEVVLATTCPCGCGLPSLMFSDYDGFYDLTEFRKKVDHRVSFRVRLENEKEEVLL